MNLKYDLNKNQDRKIEILAPAGSYESFHASIVAGADAVYAGGPKFGARAFAENFTEDQLYWKNWEHPELFRQERSAWRRLQRSGRILLWKSNVLCTGHFVTVIPVSV